MLVHHLHFLRNTVKIRVAAEHEPAALLGRIGSHPIPKITLGNGLIRVAQVEALQRAVNSLEYWSSHSSTKTKSRYQDNSFWKMNQYIEDIIKRGELYLEIERIRRLLVQLNQTPRKNKDDIHHAEHIFKALLRAKEARTAIIPVTDPGTH